MLFVCDVTLLASVAFSSDIHLELGQFTAVWEVVRMRIRKAGKAWCHPWFHKELLPQVNAALAYFGEERSEHETKLSVYWLIYLPQLWP